MATKRTYTLEQAKAAYVHRFTMEHVPAWANVPRDDGTYYAPQYRSDLEWYENTQFHLEGDGERMASRTHCYSTGATWPLGKALNRRYSKRDYGR